MSHLVHPHRPAAAHDLGVLLTPRLPAGHEVALLGWLSDAHRLHGLRPAIIAPGQALSDACTAAGLGHCTVPLAYRPGQPAAAGASACLQQPERPSHDARPASLSAWLAFLRRWPVGQPLLLAPGTLQAAAWLLAAAVALRHQVWVYVPMAFSARHMGLRHAAWRDRLLAPWLKGVSAWITLDERQRDWLQQHWGCRAPVHLLPNIARVAPAQVQPPGPAADRRLRVAFVGRFDLAQKGLDWLAQQLSQDAGWVRHQRWHLQGRGDGEARLLTLASQLGPQHLLVHRHAPLAHALACSDVLLLCSRYEGLPLVALEATAMGWPVVASRQSGLAGLLPASSQFEFGDPAGLQRALHSLWRAPARAAAVAHARRQLQAGHGEAAYQRALAALVSQLMLRPGGRPVAGAAPAAAGAPGAAGGTSASGTVGAAGPFGAAGGSDTPAKAARLAQTG